MDNNVKNESINEVEAEDINASTPDNDSKPVLLDRNVKLMSPTQMVLRRFFRSKLSIIGLVMILSLFLFCFVGPLFYDVDSSKQINVAYSRIESPALIEYTDADGNEHSFYKVSEKRINFTDKSLPSLEHPLGTDETGYDVLARTMSGGKVSLIISFLSVFIITFFGVFFGGIAGYFGGAIDNIIMRFCDILTCLPGFPILLIIGTMLRAERLDGTMYVASKYHIYLLMAFLTLISWSGTARLVRGQILSLREQEYMVAAEAMGYSTGRKIFKHLIPNVMPQLIVSMTLSLGSMILYEASLSFLGLGASPQYAAWGSMISSANNTDILKDYINIWGPPGICIIIAVLGFNFVGDGLRDALDPKMRR